MSVMNNLLLFQGFQGPVDTSPVTEGVTLFKHRLLLLLLLLLLFSVIPRMLRHSFTFAIKIYNKKIELLVN